MTASIDSYRSCGAFATLETIASTAADLRYKAPHGRGLLLEVRRDHRNASLPGTARRPHICRP